MLRAIMQKKKQNTQKNVTKANSNAIGKQSKILKKISKKVEGAHKKVGIIKQKQVQVLPAHHFKIVKVKKGLKDLGLFAGENIKKGELIIEYIGNILNKEEADKATTNQYLFEITRNKTIDGSVKWNIARYCNHACDEAANAESDVKKGRVFIKAIKNIQEGEEIVYDYGEEFINEHIIPYGCRCVAIKHTKKTELVK